MNKLTIAVIAASNRPGRLSINAAKLVFAVAQANPEIKAIFIDRDEFEFQKDGSNEDLRIAKYSELTAQADGFFIVTPEYNHSYPSSLKRMLDSEYDNYLHKPVALAGVSSGPWGGVRALEGLLPTLRALGLVPLQHDLQFPQVQDTFSAQGELLDQKYRERIEKILNELVWLTKTLKWGRENLK
ncbi:MAG: NADPH-dependent FMN reductase [Candidatus Pacebacteria bacterium CG_4_10_14_0_8_um_filter_43_12]|nr:MAG: NADPH-dependent FMN reductase [Candidatus Pacebacteria bacterium CG10_big_fil_rev_8_21_14_0_10_44_11]PIY78912.1 MAG: NADPH-dependent FMN reductase [Candidatus Pacebacteria bacterium CG_4_10_14_0_8_um_filter_43_12]